VLHHVRLRHRGLKLLHDLRRLRRGLLLRDLQAEGAQIAGITGLHDGLLALWSQVSCGLAFRAAGDFQA
jgi:hypothetical protein